MALLCAALDTAAAEPAPRRQFSVPAAERIYVEAFAAEMELLEDATGKLGIDEVSRGPAGTSFVPATLDAANVGFTHSTYWARFTLRNEAAFERAMFVRQTYPLIDYLDFYAPGPGGWNLYATGDRRPFATRPIAHRDLIFPLTLPAHGERTFYVRYQSQGPIDISLSLYSSPELMEALSREQTAYGIYYGAVIMLLVWAGLVYIAVRDNAFIAYFAYVATFGLYMLVHNGLAYQYLWPNSPRWGNTGLIVLLSVALCAALQFSRTILRAKDYIPRLDRVAQMLQLSAVAAVIATPFFSYARLISPVAALILASVIFMLTMGIVSALSGSRPARLYILAWGSFLAGSIVFLLKTFGVFPHTFLTQNGWQIGSLLEMILLSMTLSSRMNELQHQNRTDPLTLLGNRRHFDDKLAAEFTLANELRRPLSLLVMDIDNFKHYNDRFGHTQGDEAIKAVANALRKHVRKPFVACRYGGEEFTVTLPGADQDAAHLFAERLRKTVEEALGGDLTITISIGYASLSQMHFDSAEQLFDAADSALYSAKQQGRNRVVAHRGQQLDAAAGMAVNS
jgi:diguanylate cyclase (GGDEF)-like protein